MSSTIQSIKTTLVNGAAKAAAVAVISGAASLAFTNGAEGTHIFGQDLPRFVIAAGSMAVASYAGDLLLPVIVPWTSVNSPVLKKWEQTVRLTSVCSTFGWRPFWGHTLVNSGAEVNLLGE